MERLSGLRGSGRVKLITELYKVYSRVHDESFDTFYFWGICCWPISTRSTNT